MRARTAMVAAFSFGCGSFAFACGTSSDGGAGDATAKDASSDTSTSSANDAGGDSANDALLAADEGADGITPGVDGATPSGPLFAYASGYGPNIAVFAVDADSGAFTAKGTTAAFGAAPSFLAVNRAVTNLYAIDENATGRVGAYTIDPETAALTYLNDVSTQGNGPAFVSVDATGKWVFVANYGDGTLAVLPVQANGGLGDATVMESVGKNAHMMVADLSNSYVFVPCLGDDYVAQFKFDAASGALTPNTPAHYSTAQGAGPRHIAFHPNGKLAYLISETKSTLTALALDPATGLLTEIETQTTLPVGFTGTNTAAEVWVHPSGKFVYGSNRGDDSIVVFSIDPTTGKMTLVAHTKTGGQTPRDFALDPAGRFLYAANQASGTLTSFVIDPNLGTLTAAAGDATVNITMPSFVGLVHLPAP